MSVTIPWGQYERAFKEIGDAIRSDLTSPYRTKKVTKIEFAWNADGTLQKTMHYDGTELLFTLTYDWNPNGTLQSISRS